MAVLHLLAPHRCVTCARVAEQPPWCRSCRPRSVKPAVGCPRCADLRAVHDCPFEASAIVATIVAATYDGAVGDAVRAAKARGAWAGWDTLGRGLAACLRGRRRLDVDVVTWIPADPRRRRRRGRDHARDLAAHVADAIGRPLMALLTASPRRHDQAALGGHERRALPPGTFRSAAPSPPAVLLVDDVVATGATAVAASTALAAAGASTVTLAALCRAGTSAATGRRADTRS